MMFRSGNGGWNRCRARLKLHLQARKDEGSDAFRIVRANFLAHVVFVRSVAVAIFRRIAAESRDLTDILDFDEAAVVDVDELFDDSFVRAASDLSVLRIDVAVA